MEYYSALKQKEIPIHAYTQMDLKDTLSSEMGPSQKENYCVILFPREAYSSQSRGSTK